MMQSTVRRYINAIRNERKAAYALAVATHGPESAQAETLRNGTPGMRPLSYMAAQAVRMRIADLIEESDSETVQSEQESNYLRGLGV